MDCSGITYSGHALRQMVARGVSTADVESVISGGRVIIDYPDDTPFPSALLLGQVGGQPLHVVLAKNPADAACIVVTVYHPDPTQWSPDFQRRNRP
jgi:hypothetical protein